MTEEDGELHDNIEGHMLEARPSKEEYRLPPPPQEMKERIRIGKLIAVKGMEGVFTVLATKDELLDGLHDPHYSSLVGIGNAGYADQAEWVERDRISVPNGFQLRLHRMKQAAPHPPTTPEASTTICQDGPPPRPKSPTPSSTVTPAPAQAPAPASATTPGPAQHQTQPQPQPQSQLKTKTQTQLQPQTQGQDGPPLPSQSPTLVLTVTPVASPHTSGVPTLEGAHTTPETTVGGPGKRLREEASPTRSLIPRIKVEGESDMGGGGGGGGGNSGTPLTDGWAGKYGPLSPRGGSPMPGRDDHPSLQARSYPSAGMKYFAVPVHPIRQLQSIWYCQYQELKKKL